MRCGLTWCSMVQMRERSQALAEAVESALPGWVERSVQRLAEAYFGRLDTTVAEAARRAGEAATTDVMARLRRLLAEDVDAQRANPLSVVRSAVRYPTEVLQAAGVPPVARDEYATAQFPDDDYDLTPATFSELDASVAVPGLEWGAAKAWTHMQRHQPPQSQQSEGA